MRSDKSFFEFLKSHGAYKILPLLLAGILLIALGGWLGGEETEETSLDGEVAAMCSMTEGVGECRVMITYSADGKSVYGVAVLCEGAESPEVRANVTELLASLFGIGANRISILKIDK